jgi:hypothetical protein
VLLTGSGDEPCGLPLALLEAAAYPTVGPPAFTVHMEISSLPPLLCASFQFIVCCSVSFFFFCGGQSVQGAILVYPRVGWGNTM